MDARALEAILTAPATVVVMPNWVGDVVMAIPVLDALAASGRRLTALARPHLAPLLELVPSVTATAPRGPSDRETISALTGFAEAVVLPNSFRSAWLPYRAGIPRRWGYRGQLRGPLLRPAVRRRRGPKRPQIEDYGELLAAMEVAPPESWVPRLAVRGPAAEVGADALRRASIRETGGPLVALFPGAEFGPSKRWPKQRFIELSRSLRRGRPDARTILVAGPSEINLAVDIYMAGGKAWPVIGADLDLAGLAGVLAQVDLLVTNDSGPMHLAAAVGASCVALFGPTDSRRTAPAGDGHRVLSSDRWCAPCFRRRCPLLHHGCMKDLEVEAVAEAALGLLEDGRA